ncbi:MAG: acetylglutamate kinase [Gemmatimonadetes bacterium]|nr:acetylglutamate kinase [Gemmatimonadota bacterium]
MRVIKVGGRAQGDPALATALLAAWRATPGAIVLVHGGGDEVSTLQRALGGEPTFVGGRRVTTARDLDAVRMVLSGAVNKRLAAQLRAANAVGISGEDAGLLEATVTDPAFGRVGAPSHVNPALLARLLTGGFLPVVSPLGRDAGSADGAGLNVNGDDAAAAIAAALHADELLLIADVPGVLDQGVAVAHLDPVGARALIARGVAEGGMAAKLQAACAALAGGVPRVRIGTIATITDLAAGTVLTANAQPARGPTP